MKNSVCGLWGILVAVMLLTACSHTAVSVHETKGTIFSEVKAQNLTTADNTESMLPGAVIDSCFAAQNTPVFEYFHHSSIQRFMAMWVKMTEEPLYCLTFLTTQADQVIRFTDGKGDSYICYFGDDSFEIEKW